MKVKNQLSFSRFSMKHALCQLVLYPLDIMKRFVFIICLSVIALNVDAQTPVEDLIDKYREYHGATCLSLSGAELLIARPVILASPLASVVSDVQKLMVLHMSSTTDKVRSSFEANLYSTLGAYEQYGQYKSANGIVEVYAKFLDDNMVSELVIFNPNLWILNDIHGDFNVNSLEKIENK